MKKIIVITAALLINLTGSIFGKVSSGALSYFTNCNWNSTFEYPNKYEYLPSEDVYVKVKPSKYQDILYMELYVNGQFIRKETSYPYEWCKPNSSGDNYLRSLTPGSYTIKVKIKDKCGQTHYIQKQIKIVGFNPNYCQFSNPLQDLHWLKQLKQQHPNWQICEYKKNGKVYFKIFPCNITHYEILWYDCNGTKVCGHLDHQQPCGVVSGAQFKKCWYTPCNGGGGNQTCTWQSSFASPQHGKHFNKGCNVYVKVNTQKYQDIEYMELYINGSYVRKESQYPYEWCKGGGNSDHKLRNLGKGTYHLKVKIKDKCGDQHEQNCTFYVD
jgi:hypothetical protein